MEHTTIKNCTPHTINLVASDSATTAILEPCGALPRVSMLEEPVRVVGSLELPVPLVLQRPGRVTGLPEPQPGVWLIVSQMVANAVPERRDLVFPAGLVRDDKGRITGCSKLGQVPRPNCHRCENTGLIRGDDLEGHPCPCSWGQDLVSGKLAAEHGDSVP